LQREGFSVTTREISKRLRIGLALVVGFLAGKLLAQSMQHHASEFFIGGFGVGFVLTQWLFGLFEAKSEDRDLS
jgi:hypothetical protein